MKRNLALGLAALVLVLVLASRISSPSSAALPPPPSPPATLAVPTSAVLPRTVFAHYYAWYSAPPFTTEYEHWDGGDSRRTGLPDNIATSSYPLLGPYASIDPDVIRQHMEWLKMAHVGVLIFSWWGQHDPVDARVRPVMDAAEQAGLSVAFQIEPYRGRTTASTISDIVYLNQAYGSHPAFYRASRPTLYGPTAARRGLIFLYAPASGGNFDRLRGTPDDAIILARQDDGRMYSDHDIRTAIAPLHLDGVYNYGQYTYSALPPISADYVAVYSVSPGFDNSRGGGSHTAKVPRRDGASYDASWQGVASLKPEAVAVVSFNEWHEDTQIEPAKPFSYTGHAYADYDGAYGLTGQPAELAFLNRTAYWADRYAS